MRILLVESVRPFAPEGTLFGPDGAIVVIYPPRPEGGADDRLVPGEHPGPPQLSTENVAGSNRRVLLVTVRSPHGEAHLLAVDNLLANAVRHAPRDSVVTLGLRREGAWWKLSIRDQGRGVPVDEREAVFEPFHRLPDSGTGTGLGLTIAREVAQRHGGRVAFVEPDGRGAEVVLELPAD